MAGLNQYPPPPLMPGDFGYEPEFPEPDFIEPVTLPTPLRVENGRIGRKPDPRVLSWLDLNAQEPEPQPQLCSGIPEGGVTVLAGAP